MSGEVQLGWMKMLRIRSGRPRSGMIMRAATVDAGRRREHPEPRERLQVR